MALLKDLWYAALWVSDLPECKPVARTVAGERIVFWRNREGQIAASADACPHRMAPLSLGSIESEGLMCRYHGLAFGVDGKCVSNPYGPLLATLAIRSYPIEVRDGMLWVWTGDAAKADPALIPEVLAFTRTMPETAYVTGYVRAAASHKLFEDNLLDPGHADYLHPLLGAGAMSRSNRTIEEVGQGLRLMMTKENWAYPAFFRAGMPDPDGMADQWAEVFWNPNGAILIRTGATPTGRPPEEGVDTWTAHIFTPETETSTHYLYASGRNFMIDDVAFNALVAEGLRASFASEDLPMIEGQQAVLGDRDLMDATPHLFAIDRASVRARRMFDRMVAAEQSAA